LNAVPVEGVLGRVLTHVRYWESAPIRNADATYSLCLELALLEKVPKSGVDHSCSCQTCSIEILPVVVSGRVGPTQALGRTGATLQESRQTLGLACVGRSRTAHAALHVCVRPAWLIKLLPCKAAGCSGTQWSRRALYLCLWCWPACTQCVGVGSFFAYAR